MRTLTLWMVCALTACSSKDEAPPPGPSSPECLLETSGYGPQGTASVRVETVVEGLEVPWSIAFLPDGDLLVTERPGRLRLVESGALVAQPVATIAVNPGGEGGLMGLALHPDFATNRQFFLYFTRDSQNRVERWTLSEDHRSAAFERVLLEGVPASTVHHGGRMRVGPDGMLYLSVGDARDPDSAQDPNALTGKLLRLTVDGEVPADNPIPGNPAFISGARNVQGFDWLDADLLVITDHGPSGELGRSGHDEVSVARAGDNLGWPTIYACQQREGLLSPVMVWQQALPPGGAALYTGGAIPEWRGSVVVGALGAKHLQRVQLSEDRRTVTRHEVYLEGDRLRDVIMGPDGHLYVTTSNCDGRATCPPTKDRILRVVP